MGKGARLKAQRQAVIAERDRKLALAAREAAFIQVRCPKADKFFSTGIVVDPQGFSAAEFADNSAQCPYCGAMHRWGDDEMVLAN